VERLSQFHEDKVGHVDHVVDGAQTDCLKTLHHPGGRRTDFDIFQSSADIAGAELRSLDGHESGNRSAAFGDSDLRETGGSIQQTCHVPCNTEHGKPIGTVGGNFDFDFGIGAVDVAEGSSQSQRGIKDKKTRVIFTHTDLFGTAHHAAGFNAAEFGFFDLELTFIALKNSSDGGKRDDLSRIAVGCSADDLTGLFAVKDLTDREMIRAGMGFTGFNTGNDHTSGDGGAGFNSFDFNTRGSQPGAKLRIGAIKLNVIREPLS
jgi:hypothetical protein